MVYSKILKQSNFLIGRTLKNISISQKNQASPLLNKHYKVSWGTNIYVHSCYYSTVLKSNSSDLLSPRAKYAAPLNFTALLSTDGSAEQFKIVITNPSEGTSTVVDSAIPAASEISHVSETAASVPAASDITTTLSDELTAVADIVEPSLASLGLCNWTPVGLVQMLLEYLHISMHWPWWVTIAVTTVIARILLFPIMLKTQRNVISMSNHMPQLQFLQMKFGEARRTGNSIEAAKLAHEITVFMKDKNINPIKNAMLPMAQAPVFISFFLGLRAMAKAPVESMKEGGIWWVTDLTIPDPYYALPLVACSTLYVVLKIGAESGVRLENMKMAKYFMQAIPIVALPFCINFPAAVLYYWCTNNFVTLITVSILKIKPVRQYFNLPTQKPVDPQFVAPKKGFIKSVKDAFEDQKVLSTIEDRRRMDAVRFQKAGTGPIPRTYSYDPTKPRPSNVAATANKAFAAKERKS